MGDEKRIAVRYADKFRLWQELVLAVERGEGSLFLTSDADVLPGEKVTVDVQVADEPSLGAVRARVESCRPASLRFSKGVTLRIDDEELARLRDFVGHLPSVSSGSTGRRERRYKVKWPLQFRTPAVRHPVHSVDISEGGMHCEMPERVRRGHVLEFALQTPQGHALGLAGEVQWVSETEKRVGLRFLFEDKATALAFAGVLKHAVRTSGGRERTGTILVVDHERDQREYMIAALAARGYRVLWAASGEEALTLVREERPDLILIDPRQPRLDATAVCRAVRADQDLCDVPVIFVAPAAPELEGEAAAAGATDVLLKPVGLRALLATVSAHLDDVVAA